MFLNQNILHSKVVNLYNGTYTDIVEDYLLVYNPFSKKGITVLNKASAYLYKLINNKRTLYDIYLLAKRKDKRVNFSDIEKIFKDFLDSEILYLDSPLSKKELFPLKPETLGVWFHITNQCNLRCKYCFVWKTHDKMTNETAEKAIIKILVDAKKHRYKEVKINFSGGECLLELSKIIKLVNFGRKMASRIGINIRFATLTNGVLITEKTAQIIKENDISVGISLDGLGKYNDAQRVFSDGSGTFKFIEKGINNLLDKGVPFRVSVTVTSKNIENIPDLTKYFINKQIAFNFNFYAENPCAQEEFSADNQKLIKYLRKSFKIIYNNPPRYSLIDRLLDSMIFRKPHYYKCAVGYGYLIVNHDGQIASCAMTIKQPIGSINDKDIIETMRKGNFIRPRGLTVEGKTPCNTCQWKYVCCGGCPLLTYRLKGKYNVSSPYCEVHKALIPEVLRIEAKRLIKYGFKPN